MTEWRWKMWMWQKGSDISPLHSKTKAVEPEWIFLDDFWLTFDSHAIPAMEIPRRQVTVMMPMIRMSLVRSTIETPFSWEIRSQWFVIGPTLLSSFTNLDRVIMYIWLTRIRSVTVSAKPTVCMATATALANAKMRPIDPPNSGPRLRLIRK